MNRIRRIPPNIRMSLLVAFFTALFIFGTLLLSEEALQKIDPRLILAASWTFGVNYMWLWYIATRYWYRYYYLRTGSTKAIAGGSVAFIFHSISIMFMVGRYMTGSNDIEYVIQCPHCSREFHVAYKIDFNTMRKACPHCAGVIEIDMTDDEQPEQVDADRVLHQLNTLREKGVITDEEFASRRARISDKS